MKDYDAELERIFADPIFSDVKAPARRPSPDDKIVQKFLEINDFFETNGREPSSEAPELEEKKLAMALQGIRDDKSHTDKCLPYDSHGILDKLNAIMNDPIFDDIAADTTADDIFDIPEYMARKAKERNEADYIGSRKPCEDFDKFEAEFKEVKDGLQTGEYRLVKFLEKSLDKGRFFVEDGMILKVEAISDLKKNRFGRKDGRLRVIYDNGTEADIKYRTLTKNLAATGYAFQRAAATDDDFLQKNFSVAADDVFTGWIYVLKSKSADPEIASRRDLYKIGFTATSIESRLANASKETTYLCAPVEVVSTWKVYNVKSSRLESLIHKLFANVRFNVRVNGDSPQEWYVVPYHIIEQAVNYIVNKVPVSYDHTIQQLVVSPETSAKKEL